MKDRNRNRNRNRNININRNKHSMYTAKTLQAPSHSRRLAYTNALSLHIHVRTTDHPPALARGDVFPRYGSEPMPGYNLKVGPRCLIEMMKFDMGGSAATLGAAAAIAQLGPKDVEVHFVIAAC